MLGDNGDISLTGIDEACATKRAKEVKGVNLLQGLQSDEKAVKKWAEGPVKFDVIVDDGRHFNKEIIDSISLLWPGLAPGGLYFIEDLQHGIIDWQLYIYKYVYIFCELMICMHPRIEAGIQLSPLPVGCQRDASVDRALDDYFIERSKRKRGK